MTAGRFVLPAFVLTLALAAVMGCATKPPSPVPQPPQASLLHLSRTGFADLPGWDATRLQAARDSFRRSCGLLAARPDDAPMGGAGYAGAAGDWRAACAAAAADGTARDFFERNFVPFTVTGSDALFTGYYEPEVRGSRTRHGPYQTPVYGLPSDLVRVDLGAFAEKFRGEQIWGRLSGNRLTPYADRAAINAGGLPAAPILFYAEDPVAIFFLQIQGSGRAVLDDGTSVRIAYAGQNGHAYTAIGRTLIAEGQLTRQTVSLQTIRAWMLANPDQARRVMETNRSYVFFQEAPLGDTALGSPGASGAALTPLASLAVDSRLHALGAPFWVAADGDDPVRALMVAQDVGGAIRGPVRGDMFFGFGAEAERRAGAMKAPGRLYVLLPHALAAKIGIAKDYPQTP